MYKFIYPRYLTKLQSKNSQLKIDATATINNEIYIKFIILLYNNEKYTGIIHNNIKMRFIITFHFNIPRQIFIRQT